MGVKITARCPDLVSPKLGGLVATFQGRTSGAFPTTSAGSALYDSVRRNPSRKG